MQNTKIVEFSSREEYKILCEEMKELISREKELSKRKEDLRKEIIRLSNGDRMEYGIKVSHIEVSGSVDYKKLASEVLGENALKILESKYKKDTYSRIDIRSY